MDVYVIGSVSSDPRSIQRTMFNKDAGCNPEWNYDMNFVVDEAAAQQNRIGLLFQIMSHRALGDKEIGRAYIPLKELLDSYGNANPGGDGDVKREERQVQTPVGKVKDTLTYTYKIGEKFTQKVEEPPMMAYPAIGGEFDAVSSGYGDFPTSNTIFYPSSGVYPPTPVGYPRLGVGAIARASAPFPPPAGHLPPPLGFRYAHPPPPGYTPAALGCGYPGISRSVPFV
ncbi:hypothetical protein Ancab_024188 [Ancistrocladus abbreviatus]